MTDSRYSFKFLLNPSSAETAAFLQANGRLPHPRYLSQAQLQQLPDNKRKRFAAALPEGVEKARKIARTDAATAVSIMPQQHLLTPQQRYPQQHHFQVHLAQPSHPMQTPPLALPEPQPLQLEQLHIHLTTMQEQHTPTQRPQHPQHPQQQQQSEGREGEDNIADSRVDRSYLGKGKRACPDRLSVLERIFSLDPLPSAATKEKLGAYLGMSPKKIQIWFQVGYSQNLPS